MSLRRPGWGIAIFIVAVLIALRIFSPSNDNEANLPERSSAKRARSTTQNRAPDHGSPASRSAGRMIESDWNDLVAWLESDPRPSDSDIRARLLSLRGKWAEMDPTLAAETIGQLLKTNRDAITGLTFRVGLHGFLDAWPSLRVFLLDALVVTDPEIAAGIARGILDTTQSPDEYAVALRSLTRFDGVNATDGELLARFSHALDQPDWQKSAGFAESLDLARTIGTRPAAAELLRWNGNPALQSMALHEFAADHPAQMAQALEADSTIDPITRANLMARLDPAEPTQLTAIDAYFRDPQRSTADAAVFLKSFPLRSATTGNRLYSPAPAPFERDRIATGDQAALDLVNQWAADPALESLRPDLLALRTRLADWVEQAK